jgi:CRISPR-associated protein Cas2
MSRKKKKQLAEMAPDDSELKMLEQGEYEEYSGVLYTEEVQEAIFDFDEIPEGLAKVANKTYFTVIVYDMTCDSRRYQLAKLLLGFGERVQYSGFEGYLSPKQIETLCSKIKGVINHAEDRVRVYKIAGTPQVTVYGKTPLVEKEEFTII